MQWSKIVLLAFAAILLIVAFVARFLITPIGVYEKIANSGRPVVQAVEDYRSVHGLFPIDVSDLVPRFLPALPDRKWHLNPGYISCYPGWPSVGISYHFTGQAGWWVVGEGINRRLNVPGPTPRSTLTGEALFIAQQAEYEKRISRNPTEQVWYSDKVKFLWLANRHESVREECERAAKLFPDWWFPEMVLAEISSSHSDGSDRFVRWADNNPTFVNFWHLARHQRNRGQAPAATRTLDKATRCTFEPYPTNSEWVGAALAFDATRFAYDNKNFDLVMKLCQQWESLGPSYGEKSWLAFQAAAEIAEGRFHSAIEHAKQAIKANAEQVMWADNLPALLQAAQKRDTNFVYQAGRINNDWTLISQPRP